MASYEVRVYLQSCVSVICGNIKFGLIQYFSVHEKLCIYSICPFERPKNPIRLCYITGKFEYALDIAVTWVSLLFPDSTFPQCCNINLKLLFFLPFFLRRFLPLSSLRDDSYCTRRVSEEIIEL